LRVTAAGKRVFVAQGRVRGKAVCFTIGPYGQLTEYEGREKARRILQDMREGIDPRDVKKADEAAKVTLRTVADAYMGRPGKLKDSSKTEIERHVTTTFKAWEQKPIAAITEDDCRKRYREIVTKGTTGKGPAPAQANQAFSVLRALINYAGRQYKKHDGTPLILHNPVGALKDDWIELQPRTSDIDEKRVGAVWHMLTQARVNAYNRDTWSSIDLVMFLMLTGARIGEASALTWDRVSIDKDDPENCWWHIPDPKNRNPVWLPLSSQAVELLNTRQRIEGNPHVFPSWGDTGHIKDPRDMMKKAPSSIAFVRNSWRFSVGMSLTNFSTSPEIVTAARDSNGCESSCSKWAICFSSVTRTLSNFLAMRCCCFQAASDTASTCWTSVHA